MVYLCPDLVHRYWWQEGQLRREWDLFTHVTTTKVSVTPRLRFIPLSKYTRSSSARQEKSYLANACARLQKYNILYHTIGYINIIIYYINLVGATHNNTRNTIIWPTRAMQYLVVGTSLSLSLLVRCLCVHIHL